MAEIYWSGFWACSILLAMRIGINVLRLYTKLEHRIAVRNLKKVGLNVSIVDLSILHVPVYQNAIAMFVYSIGSWLSVAFLAFDWMANCSPTLLSLLQPHRLMNFVDAKNRFQSDLSLVPEEVFVIYIGLVTGSMSEAALSVNYSRFQGNRGAIDPGRLVFVMHQLGFSAEDSIAGQAKRIKSVV